MADVDGIKGEVEDVIYHNEDNGYSVFSLSTEKKAITCVGTVFGLRQGESMKINGNWVTHPSYGKQLQIEFCEKSVPTTTQGIEKYLSSGLVKGIGKKTAKKIVEMFGENTFTIIEEQPEKLVEIRGITMTKAQKIADSFRQQYQMRKAMIFLQEFDITPAYALKIYKKYKDKMYEIVKNQPYRLADEIWGIGFKMADKIAMTGGVPMDDPNRIKSGIKFVLNQAVTSGDCYLKKDRLLMASGELLGTPVEVVDHLLRDLQVEGQIFQENVEGTINIYLNFYYQAEMYVAKKLLDISAVSQKMSQETVEQSLSIVEDETDVSLAAEQRIAVMEAMMGGTLIITGGPGTGKTTTINTILRLLEKEEKEVILAAPTGRAAKRMSEATGVEAKTMHRMLGISFVNEDSRKQTFEKNEETPLEADVIIIDEASMIDIHLMNAFLRAVEVGTSVIFVGDVDQLPSVGAGNVLNDMIESEHIKVVRLQHVFRQAEESAIIRNAHLINRGVDPIVNEEGSDFFFLRSGGVDDVLKTLQELVTTRLPKFTGCDPSLDMQVLSPMRKGALGIQNLNEVLQNTLNPPSEEKREKLFRDVTFREGDKVMQIKNNYNIIWKLKNENGEQIEEGTGIFNGDIGRIQCIDNTKEVLEVVFDDGKFVLYEFTQLEELELAYAITIHKSQGSEYPVVILPMYQGPPMLMTRNLLYTAITRAKQLVVLVGVKEVMLKMVENNREINRNTGLTRKIIHLHNFMSTKN
ncbi:MAG: ATP-dependent RecD-like DNA helicase [Bacillota bacterium]